MIATPEGDARVDLSAPSGTPHGALVLGHGAGGGVQAPDLQAARATALAHGWAVALVEQPYRVAGRRAAPRAPVLDSAWRAVCAWLATHELAGLSLVCGGRSSGARVACRTAGETGAVGVLCLAFPLQPPPHRDGTPAPSRLPELDAPRVPVLVVQGENDRFGMPGDAPGRTVVRLGGDHGLKRDHAALGVAVGAFLDRLVGGG
jgi:uncharacterized protein